MRKDRKPPPGGSPTPPDRLDLAWALDRRLFDHGYAVHVIREPKIPPPGGPHRTRGGTHRYRRAAGPSDWDVVRQAVPAG